MISIEENKTTSTLRNYIIGFILSIVLTLSAYFLVVSKVIMGPLLIGIIITFALTQLIVQLLFFLHLGEERGPRWNLFMVISTIGVILVIVIGSLWIMNHLNYNMMPEEIDSYIQHEEGIHR